MRIVLAIGCLLTWISAPASTLTVNASDIGEVYQFSHVPAQIHITNPGTTVVKLAGIDPVRKGDRVQQHANELRPGETLSVSTELAIESDLGTRFHSFRIRVEGTETADYLAQVRVFGLSVLDSAPYAIDFGVVPAGTASDARTLTLKSREVANLKAIAIVEVPDFLDVSLAEDQQTLTARVKASASWGLHSGSIKVRLNSSQQPEVSIDVRADVHGSVVPDSNPFNFGVARTNEKNEFRVRLSSPAGEDFKIKNVAVTGFKGDGEIRNCLPKQRGCKLLSFRVDGDQPTGKIVGTISLSLPNFHQELPVRVWGMLIGPETKIVSLDEAMKQTAAASEGAQSAVPTTSLKDALKQATESKPSPVRAMDPPGRGPLLKWSTQNEQGLYCYLIYRADREEGPFLRVNPETIRVTSQDGSGPSYQWRDTSAVPGKTYWYQIGMVYNDGHKQDLTGPQKVVAK